MSIQRSESCYIDKADLGRRDANHGTIFFMQGNDILEPASSEISNITPNLTVACERRARDISQWMSEAIVAHLSQV